MTIILIIVSIIFGAGKLPEIGSALGRGIKDFKTEAGVGGDDEKQIEKGSSERTSSLTVPARDSRGEVVVTSGERREVRAHEI